MLSKPDHPLRYVIAGRIRLIPEKEFNRAEVKAAMRKAVRRRVGTARQEIGQSVPDKPPVEDFDAFYRRVTGSR